MSPMPMHPVTSALEWAMIFNVINRWLSKIESRNAHTHTHTHSDTRRYKHHAGMETNIDISAGQPWSNNWQTETDPVPMSQNKSLISLCPDMGVIFFRGIQPPPLNNSAVLYRCPPSLNPSLTYFWSISQKLLHVFNTRQVSCLFVLFWFTVKVPALSELLRYN